MPLEAPADLSVCLSLRQRLGGVDPRLLVVAEASVALWHFIVQREACGLRDTRHVLRDYRVPPEVAARMGAQTAPPAKPASVSRTKTR